MRRANTFGQDPNEANENNEDIRPLKFNMRCPIIIVKHGQPQGKVNNWHTSLCVTRIRNNSECTIKCKQAAKIKKIMLEKGMI